VARLCLSLLLCLSASLLLSCGDRPQPGPVSYQKVKFRKVVVFVSDGVLEGHFSLVNEQDKQLAMRGVLTLTCWMESKVSVEDKPAFQVKTDIYRGSQTVKLDDFQWIYYNSFLTEDDFVCRFRIPFDKFNTKPLPGRTMGFGISFKPDIYPSTLEMEKRVWVPHN
jgi:hypothetical protein